MAAIPTKIQIARDTAANWAASGRVLLAGEAALATDTNVLKYGDGTNLWPDLPAVNPVIDPAADAPLDGALAADVGTSVKYAREDHVHKLIGAFGLFLSETAVAPATAGSPTPAEIQAAVGTNVDKVVFYTGTDTASDAPTHVWMLDQAGSLILVKSPGAAPGADAIETLTAAGAIAAWGSVVLVNSATAVTVTLPAAAAGDIGTKITVKGIGAGAVTVAPDGTDSIAGQTVIAQNGAVTYECTAAGIVEVVADVEPSMTDTPIARYSVSGVAAGISLVNGPNILPIGALVTSDLLSSGQSVAAEHDPLAWRSGNQITVSKAGRYRIDLNAVHSTDNLSGASNQDAVGVSRAGIRINGTAIEWIGMDDTSGLADQMSGFVIRNFAAGDDIDVVVNATTAASGEDFYVSFAIEELPTATRVNPGTVPITALATFQSSRRGADAGTAVYVNIMSAGGTSATTAKGTGQRLQFTAGTAEIASGLTVGTNTVTITTAGRYRVSAAVTFDRTTSTADDTVLETTVNGTIVQFGTSTNNAGNHNEYLAVGGLLDLNIGDVIDWRMGVGSTGVGNVNVYTQTLAIEQQVVATVVDPGDVPVNVLALTVARATTTQSFPQNVDTLVALDTAVVDTASQFRNNTDRIEVAATGRYRLRGRIAWAASGNTGPQSVKLRVNGANVAFGATRNNTTLAVSEADITMNLTAGDLVEMYGNQASDGTLSTLVSTAAWSDLEVSQLPSHSIVAYTPGDVTVTPVTERRFVVSANQAATLLGAQSVMTLTGITTQIATGDNVATYDGSSLTVNAGANPVKIEALIQTNGSAHSANFFFRDVADSIGTRFGDGAVANGVSSFGIYGQGSQNIPATAVVPANTTVTLNLVYNASAGNQIVNAGSYVHVREIVPLSTVVDPGTVPVQAVSRVQVSGLSTTAFSNATSVKFSTLALGTIPYNAATGRFTLEGGKTYRMHAQLRIMSGNGDFAWTLTDGTTAVVQNTITDNAATSPGGMLSNSILYTAPTNQDVQFSCVNNAAAVGNVSAAAASIEELPSHSVTTPGTLTVNDQAASGYMDIGQNRYQWGNTTGATASEVVTFPAPFADTNYGFSAISFNNSDNMAVRGASTGTKSTTSMTLVSFVTTTGTSTAGIKSWTAMGRKP